MNCLSTEKRIQVVAALVEGNSINATVRMTGVAKHTILNLLRDLGQACAEFHHRNVRNLNVRRLQADEIGHSLVPRKRTPRLTRSKRVGAMRGLGLASTLIPSWSCPTLLAFAIRDALTSSCRIAQIASIAAHR